MVTGVAHIYVDIILILVVGVLAHTLDGPAGIVVDGPGLDAAERLVCGGGFAPAGAAALFCEARGWGEPLWPQLQLLYMTTGFGEALSLKLDSSDPV